MNKLRFFLVWTTITAIKRFTQVALVISMGWFLMIAFDYYREIWRIEKIELEGPKIQPNSVTLAERLIDHEVGVGLATAPGRAKTVLYRILAEAKNIPTPEPLNTENVSRYFSEIGQMLEKYIYYKRASTLSEGLNQQALDCDLRVFIYQAIADQAGIETHIIYSPSHAFLSWQGAGEEPVYWETTDENGEIADLTNSRYRDSDDPMHYSYRTQFEGEDIYLAELFHKTYVKNRSAFALEGAKDLAERYPEWSFIQLAALVTLAEAYGPDSAEVENHLETSPGLLRDSQYVKRVLMWRYAALGDRERAMMLLGEIPWRERIVEDYDVAVQISSSHFDMALNWVVAVTYRGYVGMSAFFERRAKLEELAIFWALIATLSAVWWVTDLLGYWGRGSRPLKAVTMEAEA